MLCLPIGSYDFAEIRNQNFLKSPCEGTIGNSRSPQWKIDSKQKVESDWVMPSLAINLRYFCCLMATLIVMPAQAEWSMVVLPDTQNYTINFPHKMPWFEAQTEWAVDAKEQYNIQLVVGTGDITARNDEWPEGSGFSEWEEAVRVFDTLTGELPYILPTGNHDYTPVRSAPLDGDRDTTKFNDYFGQTHPGMVPMEPGRYENNYSRFTAPDGRDMLIFSLEVAPRSLVLDWATTIAAQYPDDTAMVATHINIEEGGPDPNVDPVIQRDPKGDILWEWARTVPNLEFILNGHELDGGDVDIDGPGVFAARLASVGDFGQTIHEIGFNTQDQPQGGNSWLRLFTFQSDTVHVQTYSPFNNEWYTDSRNDFVISLTPIDVPSLAEWEAGFDSFYDGQDFLAWQRQFSEVASRLSPAQTAVPEPTTLVMVLSALSIVYRRSRTPLTGGTNSPVADRLGRVSADD